MNRLLLFAFWAAVAATLYFTLRPVTVIVPGSDKTQHAVTFLMLTLIAASAYRRMSLLWLAVALSAFGAAIEIVQPFFGRGRDIKDWIADTIGILVALGLVWLVRRLRSAPA